MRAELSKKLLFEYYIDGNCERKFIFILDLTGSGWKKCIPACHSAYHTAQFQREPVALKCAHFELLA
jgi:hypothetical protein